MLSSVLSVLSSYHGRLGLGAVGLLYHYSPSVCFPFFNSPVVFHVLGFLHHQLMVAIEPEILLVVRLRNGMILKRYKTFIGVLLRMGNSGSNMRPFSGSSLSGG